MQPESEPIASPPEISPPGRSISKAIQALLSGCFWVGWDYFWKLFNLDSLGDEMKEHSSSLNKKRAGVLVVLVIIAILGGLAGYKIRKDANTQLQHELDSAKNLITQFRQYNAGLPHKETPAELMGFHDETNFHTLTNITITTTTNLITKISALTNVVVSFASRPVLDLFQMERIKEKLVSAPNVPVFIFYQADDEGAIALAKQIAQVFMAAGFHPDLRPANINDAKALQNGITIGAKKQPTGPIQGAFLQIDYELGQAQQVDIEESLNDSTFLICITTNKK
jgi:hypothetical protein